MRRIDISICLINQGDTYVLQRRVDDKAKGAAGLVGAFGGSIEPHESPVEAVCRELSEETSLSPSTEDFEYLGNVEVVSDRDHKPVQIMAHVFRLLVSSKSSILAREGELVYYKPLAVSLRVNLTPATHAAFNQFIEGE